MVTVTRSQKEAYQAISDVIEALGHGCVAWNSVRKVGIREATLMALIKKQLIDVEYDAEVGDVFIKQWRYKPSDQEIMEEGGVGSILIKIGVG